MKNVTLVGEVKRVERNEKGALSIRIRNVHSNGKESNLEFLEVYGEYANTLEQKIKLQVGDIVQATWEEIQKEKLDPQTGKADGWVTFKNGIHVFRVARAAQNQQAVSATETPDGLDTETF